MSHTTSLFLISAAAGTGKTTLVSELLKSFADIKEAVSHTTRAPRRDEKEGVSYYFVNDEEFDRMIQTDGFIEYAHVFGKRYGTSKAEVERLTKAKVDILFTVDVQGAARIRKKFPQVVTIFIFPPSFEALEDRMITRQHDSPEAIAMRLQEAKAEIAHSSEYDYFIVNDSFHQALFELKSIIQAQRCRREIQEKRYQQLLSDLLSVSDDEGQKTDDR